MKAAFKLVAVAMLVCMAASCKKDNGPEKTETEPEYVIMGNKRWATKNLGATTIAGSPVTCFGDYYAQAETETRYTGIVIQDARTVFFDDWKVVPFRASGEKWDGYSGSCRGLYARERDAATYVLGEEWRIPSREDIRALYIACGGTGMYKSFPPKGDVNTTEKGIYWCDDYDGVEGLLFSDGKSRLFFPAAGYVHGKELASPSETYWNGMYWSSDIPEDATSQALILQFSAGSVYPCTSFAPTGYGLPIRPVSDKK